MKASLLGSNSPLLAAGNSNSIVFNFIGQYYEYMRYPAKCMLHFAGISLLQGEFIRLEMDEKETSINALSRDCIKSILEYQDLEQKVRRLILKACKPFCSTCSDCCCKKDFCSESLDSYWLRMIWNLQGYTGSQYDDSKGWLLSEGCRLITGRPPVCYEYLCNGILGKIQEDCTLDNLKAISALPAFAGKNALGNKHLVTLSSEQILTRMNFGKLRRQIAKSLNLFQRYETEMRPFL